jgi:ABC-type multidrug transport system fused ATPase/permease subunit
MWIDRNLTLVFLCGAPFFLYVINKLGRKIKRATKKSLLAWAEMLGKLKEALGAVKVIKVYNRQEYEGESFTMINRRLLKRQLRIAKVDSATDPLMETLGMMAGSVCLIFGAHWVYRGTVQPADFFTLLILLGATADSIRRMSDVWNKIQQANAAAERVYAIIDEQGSGLSGGQLQRIVIARAILKNPAILIFDEATSQIDADSEAKIHKAIEEIMQDRTSFIIAHRFSTIISADVIVVMDNGCIIALGQHDELIQTCPLYQSLYETQLVKRDNVKLKENYIQYIGTKKKVIY